jgi:hypothetical protein
MTRMPYDPLPCGCIPGVFACEEHKFLRRLESEMRDGYLDGRIKRDNYLNVRTKRANHLKEQTK